MVPTGCENVTILDTKAESESTKAILSDATIEEVIEGNPSEQVKSSNFAKHSDMTQDGVIKILQGVTSVEELGSCCRLTDLLKPHDKEKS